MKLLKNHWWVNAQIHAAKIRFHKDVDIVNTKELNISFKIVNCILNLLNLYLKIKNLNGSYVTIHELQVKKMVKLMYF